jgi:hypothetical protein
MNVAEAVHMRMHFAFGSLRGRVLLACAVTSFAGVVLAMAVFVRFARMSAQEGCCKENMGWSAHNMVACQDVKGHLPPAHTDAPDGRRMHSWRVLAVRAVM